MVTLIKNQIFKHLSRFTKNLSPDRINLSTLKGEGELTNLELDENVLTDLLELPSWLRLTSAWCNRVCFRIQWTHIKTVPIVLRLDEVQVVIETCPDLRSMSANQGLSSMSSGRYSFIHKVIDGMTITVNAVLVTFKSPAFVASVQVSRIVAESKTPTWKRHDLRMTRVKDTVRGEILLFKEVEWQTVRIEAKSTENPTLTPLRLLTNQARCRITIKKRLSDCFVLGSRLVLILEDLLWVLTDSQLRAALYFVESLSDLVQKATDISRKRKAARKIEMLPEYQAWISQQARQQNTKKSAISKVFSQCDVIETSFHFLSEQIDLHLCDDEGDGRSSHPHLKDGGAFQIRLHHFKVDFYPYHLSLSDRKHWPSYEEDIHAQWLEQTLSTFTANFMEAMDSGANTHTRLSRAEPHDDFRLPGARGSTSSDPQSPNGQNAVKDYVVSHLAKLMSSCVVLRLEDVTLYKVSTTTRKQAPKEFISSDKELYKLPDEMSLIHAEFTYFYYPDDIPFPLPPPQFYVYCNPVQIHFDMLTVLWLQSFGLYLLRTLSALTENAAANTNNKDIFNIDVRIEAIMPRIILAESASHEGVNSSRMQRDRPQYLQLQSSKATITNIRSRTVGSRADLATCLNDLQQGELFFNSGFPTKEGDRAAVVERLLRHVNASDNLRRSADLSELTLSELSEGLSRELFWVDAKDIWFVQLDPAWAEFTGMKSSPNKPVPLMDALPITLWLCMTENKNIHAVAHIPSLVSVQLNHYQFLFISRLLDEVSEMTTFLQMDSKKITGEDSGVICVGAALPQVEVTFVMPAHSHAKESFDLDSVIPDSSSLADIPNIPITPPKNPYEIKETDSAVIHGDVFFEETSFVADAPTAEPLPVESHSFKMSNFSTFSKGLASGFSTLITSFDSTKTGDDGLDNMSVRSDGSSDSERYVVVNLEQQNRTDILNAMFVIPAASRAPRPIIDEASEVVEDPDDLSQHSEMSILRRSDPVSVTTLKLSRVEAIYQSQGFKSALRVQCSGISSDECGSIPWDEFQSKFSSRTRAWCDERELGRRCSIKARLERAPDTEPEPDMFNKTNVDSVIRQLFTENLGAEISNVNLSMSLVSVSGLADLLNDEIMPKPVPMEILMENVQLHLSEDRSAVSQLASANNMPINVCISKLKVSRTASGAFFIEPSENSGSSTSPTSTQFEVEVARKKASEMTRENEELRRRLLAAERLHAEEKMKLSSKIDELQGERMALEVSLRKMQLTQAATQSSNQSATPASAKASQQTPLRR